jgi:hypothetical protein
MVQQSRRRQIIVNPELQRRIVFTTACAPCLAFIITTGLLGYFCARLHAEALQSDAELPSLIALFVVTVLFTVSAGAGTVWHARRVSNRIAGPMHNLSLTLARYRGGDTKARLQLRQGDLLLEIQDDVNELLEWMEEQCSAPDASPGSPATKVTSTEPTGAPVSS